MNNLFSLKDKNVLITGGGSGIGLGIAKACVEAGAHVIIVGRDLEKLKSATNDLGKAVSFKVADISVTAHVAPCVESIINEVKKIDVLVNNAGINQKKPAMEVTDQEFQHILQTNLNAVFAMSREVAIHMKETGGGSIINISSMAAYYGLDRVPAYAASKSAIEGLTMSLANEWAKSGIRVNAIAPGFIETAMVAKAMSDDPDRFRKALERTSMGKLGKPENIGHAAVFLASEAASYITGVSLRVDGGNAIGF